MDVISKLYHHVVPQKLRKKIGFRRKLSFYKISRIVEKYYQSKKLSQEERRALYFLRRHHFNLDWYKVLYLSDTIESYFNKYKDKLVCWNEALELPYVLHDEKRLYFPHDYDANTIREKYAQFLYEMDKESPHLYFDNPEELHSRVLFDCGVAEGLFPLTYIDSFKKIVLFECDPEWIEPLKATFEPYKEKVSIVNSYVSDIVSDNSITLDYYADTNNIQPTFIKMDIEGFEEPALKGAERILNESADLICAICTYHTPDAEKNIVDYMKGKGFSPTYNKGYMFFYYEKDLVPPYLRRGVVRFYKRKE